MTLKSAFRRIRRWKNVLVGRDIYFKENYEIQKERIGSDYGGWDFIPTFIESNSVIYDFGIGEDISFSLGLHSRYGCTIHAFDPTPRSIEWVRNQNVPQDFLLHEYGISSNDDDVFFFAPDNPEYVSHSILKLNHKKEDAIKVRVKRLSTIMKELGHSKIDLLKMDIEGAEYTVISDIVDSRIYPHQLLVEFHHRMPGIGIKKTIETVKMLSQAGYKLFHVSESGEEFGFVFDNA